MTEIIKYIETVDNLKDNNYYCGFEGYKINTDKRSIFVVIDNDTQCCETWGYFCDNQEDFEYYKDAELIDVVVIDDKLLSESMKDKKSDLICELNSGCAYFVEIKTSKGSFQLAVYNEHNGYYGHAVRVFDTNNNVILEATA